MPTEYKGEWIMEVKKFYVDHVTDAKEMLKRGFTPFNVFYYAPRDFVRFVFEDVNDARQTFENIKDNRQLIRKIK